MAAGDITPGRRRPDDTKPWRLEAGDYCFRGRLWLVLPGHSGARALDDRWLIIQHEDGAVTVTGHGDDVGSILAYADVRDSRWHGFLTRGVWKEVA